MALRYAMVRTAGGEIVCARCLVADSLWLRTKGLLGRSSLPEEEGVLIERTSSIHMLFMRFPIDAVFVDRELAVLKVRRELKPWRLAWKRGAKAVLELPAGRCERTGLREGDRLTLE